MTPRPALVLFASLHLCASSTLFAEPYAPTALPEGGDAVSQMHVAPTLQNIPERSEVEAPPYPGAKIVTAGPGATFKTGSKTRRTLPYVTLASTDSPDQVASFYKNKLKGWHYAHEYGMFHLFWKGTPEQKALGAAEVPTVVIGEANATAPHLKHLQGVKTEITIYYRKGAS